ncbi:MAG: hypothetical protein RJB01_1069, partial [Actinomycetota bacterium]
MARIVVIGGGIGGLATAARLAVKGHHITLLEQGPRLGGKLHTHRRDGFAFDTGPSLFTLPAVYRDLFLKTGASLEESLDLQAIEPAFAYRFADGSRVSVPGVDPAKAAIAFGDAFGGKVADEWKAFTARGGEMWRLTRGPFLQSPINGWRTLLPLANPRDVRTIAPWSNLRSLSESYFSDTRMITLVDRYATYSGSDPRKAPAVFATIPYMEQVFGAWHIGGGLGNIATVLEDRLRNLGVEIRTRTDVTSIDLTGKRVAGVTTSTEEHFPADIVVANADASAVYGRLISDEFARKQARELNNTAPSLAGFVMLVAVRGRTPGIHHHNVWFPANYNAEFDSIFGSHPHLVDDPAIYACVPDDPLMRPDENHESWFILVNSPRHGVGGIDWREPDLAENYAWHILNRLAERGTDIRDRILWHEVHTPADLEATVRA